MKFKKILLLFLCIGLSATSLAQGYDFLVREAESMMQEQKYEEALALYEKAFKSGEFHFNDYYNSACANALLGHPDAAFGYLIKAIEAGFLERQKLEKDPDLKNLQKDSRWKEIMVALQELKMAIETNFPETHSEEVVIKLPEPRFKSSISLEETLKNRRSIRSYTDAPLTLTEISQLLWAAYGITKTFERMPPFLRGGLRSAPSAGARYPLDLYVVAWNVTDLPAGVYWYKSEEHKLVRTVEGDRREALSEAAFHQPHFKTASAAIVYSAVFERNMVKYGQRGRERYVCMDLGHSAEHVYLQAYALKIGTCAIGAFTDLWLKKLVGMTREEEPLYIMPLGRVE